MIGNTWIHKGLLAIMTLALTAGIGISSGLASTAGGNDVKTVPPTVEREMGYDVLLPGDRIITGTVTAVEDGHAEVNVGEIMPRFLSLDRAREKGFILAKGDKVEIAVNDQNLVVDYHPIGHPTWHRIFEGTLTQPLVVGQDWAVIRTETGERALQVRPLARSKVAALPVNKKAVFLVDQTGKIIDATFGTEDALKETAQEWAGSPPKAAYRHVSGTLVEPESWITIETNDGATERYKVLPPAQRALQTVSEGDPIRILLDEEGRVMDVASTDGQG